MERETLIQFSSSCLSDALWFDLVPGFTSYPHLYGTVLASWASQEEPDTDSSNEEEDAKGNPEGPMEGGHSTSSPLNANKYVLVVH